MEFVIKYKLQRIWVKNMYTFRDGIVNTVFPKHELTCACTLLGELRFFTTFPHPRYENVGQNIICARHNARQQLWTLVLRPTHPFMHS